MCSLGQLGQNVASSTKEITYCTSNCGGEHCTKNVAAECRHGRCNNRTGECICSHCWAGPRCDQFVNNNSPVFIKKFMEIEMDINSINDPIAVVMARDLDALMCQDTNDCPCANIHYFIESGNSDSLFMIHPHSGVISLSPGRHTKVGSKYILSIVARNELPHHDKQAMSSKAATWTTVMVSVIKGGDKNFHRRRKRVSVCRKKKMSLKDYTNVITERNSLLKNRLRRVTTQK